MISSLGLRSQWPNLKGPVPDGFLEETAALALDEVAGKDLAEIHAQKVKGRDIGIFPKDLEGVFVTDLEPGHLRGLAVPVFLGPDHLGGQELVIGAFRFFMNQPFQRELDIFGIELPAVMELHSFPEKKSVRSAVVRDHPIIGQRADRTQVLVQPDQPVIDLVQDEDMGRSGRVELGLERVEGEGPHAQGPSGSWSSPTCRRGLRLCKEQGREAPGLRQRRGRSGISEMTSGFS